MTTGRYILPLTVVTDAYSYFSCPRTEVVNVQAFNNGIDVGYGQGGTGQLGSAVYLPVDEYLALTSYVGPRVCDEIRFKNHVAGQAGQIQITAQAKEDTGLPLAGNFSSNFVTINASGQAGATFPGGIQLPEQVGAPAVNNTLDIVFADASKVIREYIAATNKSGTQHTMGLGVIPEGIPPNTAPDFIELDITSFGTGASGQSSLQVTAQDSVNANPVVKTIWDSASRSGFLQCAVAQTAIVFGNAVLNWTASTISATTTVTHGLGRTPTVVLATPHDTGNTSIIPPVQAGAIGSTTFGLQAVSQVSGTFSITYCWIAIG